MIATLRRHTMGDILPKFKAAAVQAAPVFLDREGSVEKACALIETAGHSGADLVALPEVFIPGNPYWAWYMGLRKGLDFSAQLFLNSVDIPSEATARISEAARRYGTYVVVGINERENKTLYNTLLFFDRKGQIMGKHRKFKPTGGEKLVWGEGDGSTHKVYDTEVGRLGALICGEHTMALPGFTLAAMGEQVHVASWIGFGFVNPLSEICSRYYAIACNTFVICSQSVVDEPLIKKVGVEMETAGTWSAIIEAGTGRIMAGPLAPGEEGIVYAEIDLNQLVRQYFLHETTGHYWPKQFQVYFDAREIKPLYINVVPEPAEQRSAGDSSST